MFVQTITVILIFFVLLFFEQKTSRTPISLNSMLLIYGGLYISGAMVDERTINVNVPYMMATAVIITYLSSKSTEFVFRSIYGSELKVRDKDIYLFHSVKFKFLILCLLAISILTFFYLFFIRMSFFDFLNVSRAGRSLLMQGIGPLMFFKDTIAAIYILSLTLFIFGGRSVFYRNLLLFSGVFTLIYAFVTISRAHFVLVALSTLYVYSLSGNIRTYQTNILICIGVLLATTWKWLLSSIIFKGNIDLSTFNLSIPSEFVHWSNITNNILNEELLYGRSFLDGILSLIYPFYDVTALSVWYVKKYEPLVAEIGGGRGFSLLAEAIVNFGYAGIPVVFMSIGFVLGYITYMAKSRSRITFIFVAATVVPIMHQLFRSEFISLTKTWWWYMIVPIFFVIIISRAKV